MKLIKSQTMSPCQRQVDICAFGEKCKLSLCKDVVVSYLSEKSGRILRTVSEIVSCSVADANNHITRARTRPAFGTKFLTFYVCTEGTLWSVGLHNSNAESPRCNAYRTNATPSKLTSLWKPFITPVTVFVNVSQKVVSKSKSRNKKRDRSVQVWQLFRSIHDWDQTGENIFLR